MYNEINTYHKGIVMSRYRIQIKNLFLAVAGCIIFAIGVNFFVTPHGMYNGGIFGFAQLIRSLVVDVFKLNISDNIDLVGILYFLINVPILYLAWKKLGRPFFIRTLITIGVFTTAVTFVPVLMNLVIEDVLTSVIIGGLLAGFGMGLVLTAGFCAGGQDVIGVYFSKVNPRLTVGKISLIVNVFVFALMAFRYDIEIVIYSLIYTAVLSVTVDRFHMQNIITTLMVVTKEEGIDKMITSTRGRGVTVWDGYGSYSGDATKIIFAVVNKFEVNLLVKDIKKLDPRAFILQREHDVVRSTFEKRL